MEYYSTVQKNEILPIATKWSQLENIPTFSTVAALIASPSTARKSYHIPRSACRSVFSVMALLTGVRSFPFMIFFEDLFIFVAKSDIYTERRRDTGKYLSSDDLLPK